MVPMTRKASLICCGQGFAWIRLITLEASSIEHRASSIGWVADLEAQERKWKKSVRLTSKLCCAPAHFSGASGSRSITYFPRATLIMGTPGTLRIRLFRSRSFARSGQKSRFLKLVGSQGELGKGLTSYYVDFVLHDPIAQAIICINSGVRAV